MKLRELIQENDMISFFKDLQKNNPKFKNLRVHGDPEHDELRRQDQEKRDAEQHAARQRAQDATAKDHANLPHLEAEYAKMLARYKSLGGSDWQYADREQNLTSAEREARGMEHSLRHLHARITAAKKHGEQGVAEAYTPAPVKPPRSPRGFNKQGTGWGNKLAQQTRDELAKKKQGVAEGASPMIKPPTNRFNNKQEAFAHAREHGGKVFKSTYIDPNTGNKNINFVVKKEQGVAEGAQQAAIAIAKKKKKGVKESATVGATSAANIGTVVSPQLSPGKARGKKSYTGSIATGSGTKAPPQPKVVQPKNADGTAKNGLEMKGNIFGGPAIKR